MWPSLIIIQMVPVRCISRSHRLKIDFQEENFKKNLRLKTQGLALFGPVPGVTRDMVSFQQIPICKL